MKKHLTLFLLLFLGWAILPTQNVNAQTRLGYKAAEVRSEFTNLGYKIHSEYVKIDGRNVYTQTITFNDRTVVYYYTDDMICYACAIVPINLYVRNNLIVKYTSDPEFVKITDTHWKWYTDDGVVVDINLISSKDTGYFFWWE